MNHEFRSVNYIWAKLFIRVKSGKQTMLTVMGVSVKWSHCLSLKEFEKWGIKMINGDGVISVQWRLMGWYIMKDGKVRIRTKCPMNYDSFKKVTCQNHNFYMIHSSDRFGITEHREPPHGQQVVIIELVNEWVVIYCFNIKNTVI